MVRRATPDFRRLGLVSALIAAIPGALLAQDRPDKVLPPPSLFEPAPPSSAPASDVVITAPRPSAAPVTVPAAAPPAATAAKSASAAAPAPTSPAPAPRQVEAAPSSASMADAAQAEKPWYKRMWATVTGWFGGGESSAPAQKDPTMVAVAPSSTSATPVALSSPRESPGVSPTPGYAMDTPDRTVRTGVLGQCVKTGMWEPSDVAGGCGAGPRVAKVDETAAMPRATEPKAEPVEVQPLAAPALKEEKSLEVEPPVAMPAPEPEPVPAPLPKQAEPQMTTLSADALFALGSYQLKPAAKSSLDDFAAQLKSLDYQRIKIVGHTDPTGTAAFNDKLSKQRADVVKRYLVARGVPSSRIDAEGVGSAMPMVIETDCAKLPRTQKVACYQPDRRVDIEVHGASSHVANK